MNDVQLCLLAAKTLISDPAEWTQLSLARDAGGTGVLPLDHLAVQWCAVGAIWTVAPSDAARDAALEIAGTQSVIETYNDAHTHAEVMALFDRAIERAA